MNTGHIKAGDRCIFTQLVALLVVVFSALATAKVKEIGGVVEKDVDGDTIWLSAPNSGNTGNVRLKIRMMTIDAPEAHLPSPQGMVGQGEFGDAATEILTDIIPVGAKVTVQDHGEDKYKRTLGTVFLKGRDVNLMMVEKGWAIPYVICSGPTCNKTFFEEQNISSYIEACEAAREEEIGIFDRKKPLKEMPFEFRMRIQNKKPEKYVGDFRTKKLYRPENYNKVDLCQRIFFLNLSDAKRAGFVRTF